MIENNRILFGYGTIVFSYHFPNIKIIHIEPAQEIGSHVKFDDGIVKTIKEIEINISFAGLCNLEARLENINSETDELCIGIKQYVLDFSNYKPESVAIVLKQVRAAIKQIRPMIAC